MKTGKLPVETLKKCVFNNIGVRRSDVLVHTGIGEDCSVVEFGDKCCVLSTDPITGSNSRIGWLAVHINCNDIASCGIEPLGILVTILAPKSACEEDIFNLMNEINKAASDINVEVLGGHTEVTEAVNKMVVSVSAVGKGPVGGYITSSGAREGDFIVVSKYVGLEGTAIIAEDYHDYLNKRMDNEAIERARNFIDMVSVVKEGITGGKLGASSMHDATEGGLLGALWEVAEASGVGFEIYKGQIPILPETERICSIMGINPLRLISSGMMVMTIKDGDLLVNKLKEQGINASCIGRIVGDKSRRVMVADGVESHIAPPESDELFNVTMEN